MTRLADQHFTEPFPVFLFRDDEPAGDFPPEVVEREEDAKERRQ